MVEQAVLIPNVYLTFAYGFIILAGLGMLLVASIYMAHVYAQLEEMNKYLRQTAERVGEMGLAILALKDLEKETRTEFANATIAAIDAIKLLRHEIEYQRQIAEISRRRTEASRTAPLGKEDENGKPWEYSPVWNQP